MSARMSPERIPVDWIPCPSCRGEKYVSTEVSFEQKTLSKGRAPMGKLVCPTCGSSGEVLAPSCARCGHFPSMCACVVFCRQCPSQATHAAWDAADQRHIPRCSKHQGHDAVALTESTVGALRRADHRRESTEVLRRGEIPPGSRAKPRA